MRRFFLRTIFVSVSCVLSFSGQAVSHSGGLDPENCHHNRKTDEYHCHDSYQTNPHIVSHEYKHGISESKANSSAMITYDRNLYGFESYPTMTSKGFYTGNICNTSIDHVVSLKDAHVSGAGLWPDEKRIWFANDRLNHVPACTYVNSSKGSSTPGDFVRKSSDGSGAEYTIRSLCAYLGIYYRVKNRYGLTFKNNDPRVFRNCGMQIAD